MRRNRRFCAIGLAAGALLIVTLGADADHKRAGNTGEERQAHGKKSVAMPKTDATPGPPKTNSVGALASSDVMATVEGRAITRSELTYFWLQMDARLSAQLGKLLADRWKTTRGTASAISVPQADIYRQLYAGKTAPYAPILSSLVTNRLVAIEAERKGILVTKTEAMIYAHAFFDDIRRQQGINMSDEKILEAYQVPHDVFLEDMFYRARGERLLAADIAHRNGHSIGPDDWVVVRQLFLGVRTSSDAGETAQQFAEVKQRIEALARQVQEGNLRFEEAARNNNDDDTRSLGGLRGPILRGATAHEMEAAIFRLKPGELSAPLQDSHGWYVFAIEKRGSQLSTEERAQAWKQLAGERFKPFIAELRKKARITSAVPLPLEALPPGAAGSEMPPAPPVIKL